MTHARTIPDFSTPLPASRPRSIESAPALMPLPAAETPAAVRAEALTVPALRLLLRTARTAGEFVTAVIIIAGGVFAYGFLPPL